MTVYVSSMTTWWNVGVSGVNGRYYWKDSSLDNRYCNWSSCNRFNRYFLLWFIFRIGFIPVVIGWIELWTWKRKNSTGFSFFFCLIRGGRACWVLKNHNSCLNEFLGFQKNPFRFSDDVFEKRTSMIDSEHLFFDSIYRYFRKRELPGCYNGSIYL